MMGDTPRVLVLVAVLQLGNAAPSLAGSPADADFFENRIRPVLVDKCYGCHSHEAESQGKLRGMLYLDTRDGTRAGGESGPAVVPGKPGESLLMRAIKHEDFEMPPKGKLPDETIADFERWIETGAFDPRSEQPSITKRTIDHEAGRDFWSFRPLARPIVPQADLGEWARSPIDHFILAQLESQKLRPNALATPHALVRRAYLDLIGLPPTPSDHDAWASRLASDAGAGGMNLDAWGALIDQLLESRHFGERWARHWMDIARFAESQGYEHDSERPTAYHYRDFAIRAFNEDMPYDQFVRWQLAGDELAPDEPMAWMATGFLAAGVFPTQVTETEFESTRYDELDDMVATSGLAFLGLSVGCARCHDHKFDPITAHEYYQLVATFGATIRAEKSFPLEPSEKASLPHGDAPPVAERQEQETPSEQTENSTKLLVSSEGLPHLQHHADGRGYPHFYPETYVLRRGDVHQKGAVAQPGVLRVLTHPSASPATWQASPAQANSAVTYRRTALANWVTDADQGAGSLAARVMVNRLWQHHFGRGIVSTPNDFGETGDRPTHPELLDWLAAELVEGGWKLKRLHRLIMTSAVYMQSSSVHDVFGAHVPNGDVRRQIDPENRLWWRRLPRRLEAEAIRDSMLAVAGELDATPYGPGTLDESMRRRSIYFLIKRSQLIPSMMLFDWPEHLVSIGQRASTTTAPQALLFMNSPLSRQMAERIAEQIGPRDPHGTILGVYRALFSRAPSPEEITLAKDFLAHQRAVHRSASPTADAARTNDAEIFSRATADLCQTLLGSNEFIYVD